MHVARVVKDHRNIGALACKAGARAAGQDGGACGPAGCQCSLNIRSIFGQDYPNGELTIVGRVCGVKCPRAEVEADIASNTGLEDGFELAVRCKAFMSQRRLIGEDRKWRGTHGVMVARCAMDDPEFAAGRPSIRALPPRGHLFTASPCELTSLPNVDVIAHGRTIIDGDL